MSSVRAKIPDIRLDEKTVIVTGANTGIGKETARELARKGARVILACRDSARADAARDDIVQDTLNENVTVKILDLGSLQSVKKFADEINAEEERIDILVNNAGAVAKTRQETQDGFEMCFGVNHLGHFHLTNLLLDKLRASTPSRIVIVSSMAHQFSNINLSDVQYKRRFKSIPAYCRSKTANILHTVHLAKLLKGSGVTVHALHPGTVKSDLFRDYGNDSFFVKTLMNLSRMIGQKPVTSVEGAITTLYCCLEPSIAEHSGRYYVKCKKASPRRYATNGERASKLWVLSTELCASVIPSY